MHEDLHRRPPCTASRRRRSTAASGRAGLPTQVSPAGTSAEHDRPHADRRARTDDAALADARVHADVGPGADLAPPPPSATPGAQGDAVLDDVVVGQTDVRHHHHVRADRHRRGQHAPASTMLPAPIRARRRHRAPTGARRWRTASSASAQPRRRARPRTDPRAGAQHHGRVRMVGERRRGRRAPGRRRTVVAVPGPGRRRARRRGRRPSPRADRLQRLAGQAAGSDEDRTARLIAAA